MVNIGQRPILWHILKIYSCYGFEDFVLALGYKGEIIKQYFTNYHLMTSNITAKLSNGNVETLNNGSEDWTVRMIDTGNESMTGGRLLRLKELLHAEDTFMLTYGDGVTNLDIRKLIDFHKHHGKLATVTAVRPPSRFGAMVLEGEKVSEFAEKPQAAEGWISGGFFVFETGIFNYLKDDATILEKEPLENLARDGHLMAYRHHDFWMCMDTLRDKKALESMWKQGNAPWKLW
jgi:glucose-1-phosphate cytidylyltransferase